MVCSLGTSTGRHTSTRPPSYGPSTGTSCSTLSSVACSGTVLDRPSLWSGSTPPAASFRSTRPSLGWSTGYAMPAPEGRTELVLAPIQLPERIARLIPPPRVHRHRYHGVLAPNAKLRAAVTCIGRPEAETSAAPLTSPTSSRPRPQPSLDAEPTRGGVPGSPHQSRSHPVGRLARTHLRGVAAALPRVWRSHEDPLLHHRPACRRRYPGAPRAPVHAAPDLTRSRPTTGRLPPRPDPDLRSHRGRTSPRVRVRPVPAPRVRPLKRLVPLPSPTASAFRPPRPAPLSIPASQSIIRASARPLAVTPIRSALRYSSPWTVPRYDLAPLPRR